MPPKWRSAMLSGRQGLSQHESLVRQPTKDAAQAGTLSPLRHALPAQVSWVIAALLGSLRRFHCELGPMR